MARYLAEASEKRTRRLVRTDPCTLNEAETEAHKMLRSGYYATITILRDSEGEDHPDNKGKFFLHRIIK